ncbi:hypothetical protein LMG29660_02807 [Burkholderia puraquae]|uniref:catalase n=1 Tax=Burkholderia puraquae TaxID=1904757 RepID=A0A6J5DQU0_9BURK|nr:hypothetical protein LMG29660_02807 [Burkholderia puraquae]
MSRAPDRSQRIAELEHARAISNDPLLQGRLFLYTDTQLSRLGGPNFREVPINRPVCPFAKNPRDAMHRQAINVGQAVDLDAVLNVLSGHIGRHRVGAREQQAAALPA